MYHGGEAKRKRNPKEKSNFLSVITFFFTAHLFKKGIKKDITEDDIYEVLPQFKSERVGTELEAEWISGQTKKTKNAFFKLLWNSYGWYYLFLGLLQLSVKIIMITVLPKVQGKLISYFTSKSTLSKKDAIYYASLLIGLNLVLITYNHNYMFLITELGIKIKTALCSLIYRKSLKLQSTSLSKNGVGKIVTVLTKDVNNFENVIIFLNDIWISLVIFIVAFCLIYSKIGITALFGMSLLIVMIPAQVFLGHLTSKCRFKAALATDKRLQITQKALSFIKQIKMQTWENVFISKIIEARKEEMKKIKYYYFARTVFIEIGAFIIMFTWYIFITVYTQFGNHLTAETAFFLRECLRALRSPVTISIPLGILRSAEVAASIKRIQEILTAEELDVVKSKKPPLIHLSNVSVELNKPILKDVNFKIDKSLNVITGKVGAGKTVLLKTILEELPTLHEGKVHVTGSISYAAQTPWLFPSTIKQNILFGQKFDSERYEKVVKVCGLDKDFTSFRRRDETIIDDGGRNLSKGQQTRIALARAIYCDSDIYLLDDCLSTLDVYSRKMIFQECVVNFLANKIVLLVSQQCNDLLDKVDKIFIVENMQIRSVDKQSLVDSVKVNKETEKENYSDSHLIEKKVTLQEKCYENIYHEIPKKGKVTWENYKKFFNFGGGLLFVLWILILYVATQTSIGYAERSISSWINIQQNMSEMLSEQKMKFNNFTYQQLVAKDKKEINFYTVVILSSIGYLCLRTYALFSFSAKSSLKLHKLMCSTVVKATMNFFDSRYFGNILNRFSKDLGTIDEIVPFNVHECLKFFCQLASVVILILSVNIYLFIPFFVFFILLLLIRRIYIPTGRSIKRLDAATRSPMVGHINSTLEGLESIRAYEAQRLLITEFDKHQDLFTSTFYMEQSALRAFAYVLDMLCMFFTTAVIIRFLIYKDTEAGYVGLAITQALSLPGRLQWGIKQWAELECHMTAVERVLEYIDAKEEDEETPGNTLETCQDFRKIEFRDVFLIYKKSRRYVLKEISFTVKPGEKIGIVGRTGVGKSSLVSLLFRLHKYEGNILINGTNIQNIPLKFLRSQISIVSQDPLIFSGSIRENLDPLNLFKDEEIWNVVEATNLQGIVTSLDYTITDDEFSLGQKLMLCLARALLKKPKILILDEVAFYSDSESEIDLVSILENHFKECTVLSIFHNLEHAMHVDRIMVLEDGKIAEFDKPEVLLNRDNGIFQEIAKKLN